MIAQKKTDDNVTDSKMFELEEIKNAYYSMCKISTKDESYYINLNDYIYVLFDIRARQIINEPKLIEMNQKMAKLSPNPKFEEEKKKFAELMTEYKNILEEAKKECEFYKNILFSLIHSLDKTSDKIYDAKEKYEKLCNEIIESRFKCCINYEKKIINLSDKVKNIKNINNII